MKVEIVKKAWKVWVHSHLEDNGYISSDELPPIYADNIKDAKNECDLYDAKNEDGDKARYIDIKCVRSKFHDMVLYNGEIIPRWVYEERLKTEKRNEKLRALNDKEMYYVQDSRSYCGNSVFWWGLESRGYTTDLMKAQKYTKDEIIKQFSNGRDTDIIWPASHVEKLIKTHVDAQYLEHEFCV